MTILKDKETRESKGVAFVLFLDRQMAQKAVAAINKKQVHVLLIRQNMLGGRRWVAVGVTLWLYFGKLCDSSLMLRTQAAPSHQNNWVGDGFTLANGVIVNRGEWL